ncbi:MAG: 4'-phosphopantetheinyl transferase superfamily protein [Cyanobacteria bacterium P01_D01_bin.156]
MDQSPHTIRRPRHPHWQSPTADVYFTSDTVTVDLWRIPLDRFPTTEWLSEDELARMRRYRFEKDQRKFAVARSSLRQILSYYIQTHPKDIAFEYGTRGKPFLQTNERGINFNLSHSGEYALCGVAQYALGVDIEQLKPMERLDGLIKRCLAPSEQCLLAQTSAASKSAKFLEYWTCKEAYLKATGQGISESLAAIEIILEPAPIINVSGPPWQLQTFSPCEGYTAALVADPSITQMRFWNHDHVHAVQDT